MATLNDERQEQQRWTIGSIRDRWRLLFYIFYVAQALPGISFIVWLELARTTTDSPIDTIKAIIWGIAVVGGAALATTIALVEVQELMLGTRDVINEMLQKRRDAAKAEGVEIGVEIGEERGEKRGEKRGRADGIAETLAWVARRDAARENDEPFDEPPPDSDKSDES